MRTAPQVQALFDGRGAWQWTQGALHATSGAGAAFWLARMLEAPAMWAPGGALAAGVLAAAFACRRWPALRGRLRWDGTLWTVEFDGGDGCRPGHPVPAIDLGRWMLVRFALTPAGPAGSAGPKGAARGSGGTWWLPLSRADNAADWSLLRSALFDRPPTGGGPAHANRP